MRFASILSFYVGLTSVSESRWFPLCFRDSKVKIFFILFVWLSQCQWIDWLWVDDAEEESGEQTLDVLGTTAPALVWFYVIALWTWDTAALASPTSCVQGLEAVALVYVMAWTAVVVWSKWYHSLCVVSCFYCCDCTGSKEAPKEGQCLLSPLLLFVGPCVPMVIGRLPDSSKQLDILVLWFYCSYFLEGSSHSLMTDCTSPWVVLSGHASLPSASWCCGATLINR